MSAALSPSKHIDEARGTVKKKGVHQWLGDAIYGVNDGLGAIFGIIAGVAGYTSSGHTVLVSGFFGAMASTLSMGAGAWLATKSENELLESGLAQAKQEIVEHRENAIQELAAIYEDKGFEKADAERIARTIAADDEHFLRAMAQEKHDLHESTKGNPWSSGVFGAISTFIGAIIPLIPFFFLSGTLSLIVAAIVSLAAHFVVGAAKSIVTVRAWWISGIEMTIAGILVGVLSYALGLAGNLVLG